MKIHKMEGLVAAPFTPMDTKGQLNLSVIGNYYRLLKHNQIRGAFICGSTGEGPSLTNSEKKRLAEAWADAVKEDLEFKLILLVGGTSLEEGKDLARFAKQRDLDAIAFTAPYYFKPAHAETLAACCSEIAAEVPDVPFYYYHIPAFNGVYLPMIELLQAIEGRIPNFAGIKYTHEDFMDFLSCMLFREGRYDMLWGRDENMLPALVLGAKGAVGSTFNYAAPLYHQLIHAYESGDLEKARALQMQSIELIRLLGKYGGIATGKAYMKLVGLDCGEFRLPVKNMNRVDFASFSQEVESLGFDNYKSRLADPSIK